MELLRKLGADGSRAFANFRAAARVTVVADHLRELADLKVTEVVELPITWEGFVKFTYRGEEFDIGTSFGDRYDVFVKNADCPDELLIPIVQHLTALLGDPWRPTHA